jgi:branched-chain amino acid transport system ATP-binding protein
MALLEVRGAMVRFGGVMAVGGVDIDANSGVITGLIGPNGAGKTTLFNVISGMQRPTSGTVTIDGRDVTHTPTHKRARMGLARTFQRLETFASLSVRDNVRVAAEVAHRSHALRVADELLERVGVAHLADVPAGDLPTGNARLVEVARALAVEPRLLLLDEPASGLDEGETLALGVLLRSLVGDGLGVLIVEHDMSLVMDVCDHVYVLDLGRIIAAGTPYEVQQHPAVLEAYLGVA